MTDGSASGPDGGSDSGPDCGFDSDVLAHARALLAEDPAVALVEADMHAPGTITDLPTSPG